MKLLFSKRAGRLAVFFAVMFIAGVILINCLGYLFNMKYISVFAAAAEIDKYEVKSRLLMDALDKTGVCEPERAAGIWAEGLMQRSAALQYAVMDTPLKLEYARQLEKIYPNWVNGISSPWVDNYEITGTDTVNEKTKKFHLKFYTRTSTGPAENYKATLTIEYTDGFWRITDIDADKGLYVYTGFKP